MPFSHDAFLDVFGAYNAALWPAAAVLWLVTAGLALRWERQRSIGSRTAFGLLAAHWAWCGVAYHWFFFRRINPAATMFAALFVVQAANFAWLTATSRGRCTIDGRLRGALGGALVGVGLAYPLAGLAFGLEYPRTPLFAVPCPTTLVTAGFLLTAEGVPRWIGLVPLLWAIVGSVAAFALGIRADLALVAAAVLLAIDMLAPSALGARG